ncbi:carboxypeptidase regulatory-like domain-containing protein [Phocaeicola barnesiae]|uniref:FEKKY domain-containing protein n=1 Tax=Phocaeicola barnesiae TaxID=376804 RepID=UPI0025A33AD9|nr:carboxypeptidase regulatory-like domain-containing protein [Phocaeicola barnesiae]MDM8254410.1 carboxypeptidase regulatory-like domain-containing protein [Phocaeicola barnesiae]
MKVFFTILLWLVVLPVKATGQWGDIIRLEGKEWVLLVKPIESDTMLGNRVRAFLPDNISYSTGNYSCYTASWEIRNGYLCLRQIEADVYDEASNKDSTLVYEGKDLQSLFPSYYKDGEIQARWFSGELRAGKGNLVRYVHDGFDRNMETEQVLTVRNGKVLKTETYHNYRRPGLNLKKAQKEIACRFPWKRFPEYRGEQIIFVIGDFQMTDDGHFVDCDVHFFFLRSSRKTIEDRNHPLALAFKETLKSIYPWEVLFINGKYTMEYRSFTMPLRGDITHDKGDSAKYTIVGRVYGESVRQRPPYDVVHAVLVGSNLSMAGQPFQGWLTDSTGCFRIKGLEAGTYHLKAEYVGLDPCDTVITLPSQHNDTLRMVLPLWYDYILKYDCSPELSKENILKGHPKLRLVIPEEQEQKIRTHFFWKKYGVSYDVFYPLKKDGTLDCYLGVPNHLLTTYNQVVFDYLDKKFGTSWRKEAPKGIFGLDKSLDEFRDYKWFINTLHKESKYPVKLLNKGKECLLRIEYAVDSNGYIVQPKIISCSNCSFRKTVLDAFKKVMNVPTLLKAGKDTLVVQYKLDSSATVNPDTDVLVIGYTPCDKPILMK